MYTRQHEAAERAYLRRWLRREGHELPAGGDSTTPTALGLLLVAVVKAGGDGPGIMAQARAQVDRKVDGGEVKSF